MVEEIKNETKKEEAKKEFVPTQITLWVNEKGGIGYKSNVGTLQGIGLMVLGLAGMVKRGVDKNKTKK